LSEHPNLHGPTLKSVYLDYHASTPVDPSVVDAMLPWWHSQPGNPHSGEHAFGWRAREAVEAAKSQIGDLVGVDGEDLILTSGATEANNIALLGVMGFPKRRRNTLIVSSIDHASVLEPARELSRQGCKLIILPVLPDGTIDKDALARALDESVLLVSIGAVNSEIGTIQDLKWIADRCHEVGTILHSDCAQALNANPQIIGQSGVDLASLSAHKAYGPQGIGALFIAPGMIERMARVGFGGGQQLGLRSGTVPTALCVGFGKACEILRSQGENEREATKSLRDLLISKAFKQLPGIQLNGNAARRHPGNVNLMLGNVDARDIIQFMQPAVALSTGSACHSGINEPSHVLRAIGLSPDEAYASVRFGIGRFSTVSHIEFAVDSLVSVLSRRTDSAHQLIA
jgi:cysteine desulfurase